MEKRSKRKSSSAAPGEEQVIADLIKKVQEQLSVIEKKLDTLINQSPEKPFEKSYSQGSPRRFDPSFRHDAGRRDNYPRERTYTRVICAECKKECEIPFKPSGDRPVYCKECFSRRKHGGPFNADRDNRPQERSFPIKHRPDKRRPIVRGKLVKKKISSPARRKKRA